MKNIYDDKKFFDEYAKMSRSQMGLAGAGEWHQFRKLFPDLTGKRVLDLGCGYGWHCKYAAERGAGQVLGIDQSEKMIGEAKVRNADDKITYRICGVGEYEYPSNTYDCVISNLVLHYVENLDTVYGKIYETLKSGGVFLMNIEHPVFTAGVHQDWVYRADKTPDFWPVDDYFYPGERITQFLGQSVRKHHHTLTQILMGLIRAGFTLRAVEEAMPDPELMGLPGMKDEMRRPMMLLVRVDKTG